MSINPFLFISISFISLGSAQGFFRVSDDRINPGFANLPKKSLPLWLDTFGSVDKII